MCFEFHAEWRWSCAQFSRRRVVGRISARKVPEFLHGRC